MNFLSFRSLPILLSAFASLFCISCSGNEDLPDPDIIWDFAPYSIDFDFVDAQGATYLDPDRSDGLYGKGITAEFDGKAFEISDWDASPFGIPDQWAKSRMCLALFRGLHPVHSSFSIIHSDETGKLPSYIPSGTCWLRFGEFQSETDMEKNLTLTIPSMNRKITIHINHTFRWKKGKPDIHTTVTIDGKEAVYSEYKQTEKTVSGKPHIISSRVIKIEI